MANVKVITDSIVEIPLNHQNEFDVKVTPQHVIRDEERFLDNVELPPDEFYRKLPDSKLMPTTSKPSPQDYKNLYNKYLPNHDGTLSKHISSGLSGTVDSTLQAKIMAAPDTIEVFDSQLNSKGAVFQVKMAAQSAKNSASLEEWQTRRRTSKINPPYFLHCENFGNPKMRGADQRGCRVIRIGSGFVTDLNNCGR